MEPTFIGILDEKKQELMKIIIKDLENDVPAKEIIDKLMFSCDVDLTSEDAYVLLKEALIKQMGCEKKYRNGGA